MGRAVNAESMAAAEMRWLAAAPEAELATRTSGQPCGWVVVAAGLATSTSNNLSEACYMEVARLDANPWGLLEGLKRFPQLSADRVQRVLWS